MAVELLRPHNVNVSSLLEASPLISNGDAARSTKPNIHPPNKRMTTRRVEPTSALQLARELADAESVDTTLLNKLADLTTLQLAQGPAAERLQLFFTLSRLLSGEIGKTEATTRLVTTMLAEVRSLFSTIAPTLRWTTLAALATIIDRPCFSTTARKLGSGYLCALIPEALEDAAAHDKAAVYSILHDISRRGFVDRTNSNRVLANLAQYLRVAIRDTNIGLRRQLLEQHITLLEAGVLTNAHAIFLVQSSVREFAPTVAETLVGAEQDFFMRSVRRALI